MIVMMIAITASLNASSLVFGIASQAWHTQGATPHRTRQGGAPGPAPGVHSHGLWTYINRQSAGVTSEIGASGETTGSCTKLGCAASWYTVTSAGWCVTV